MAPEELLAALEEDVQWREAELDTLLRLLDEADSIASRGLRRSFVPIVQAHAEGFVRFALRGYLRYITAQSLVAEELLDIHVAWMLSPQFNRIRQNSVDEHFSRTGIAEDNKKARLHYAEAKFLESLGSMIQEQVSLDDSQLDRFDQNLDKPYLIALLYQCGLDPSPHEGYSRKLNGLVIRRNAIAHGENEVASLDEIRTWHSTIVELFRTMKAEVFRAAASRTYLKSTV